MSHDRNVIAGTTNGSLMNIRCMDGHYGGLYEDHTIIGVGDWVCFAVGADFDDEVIEHNFCCTSPLLDHANPINESVHASFHTHFPEKKSPLVQLQTGQCFCPRGNIVHPCEHCGLSAHSTLFDCTFASKF